MVWNPFRRLRLLKNANSKLQAQQRAHFMDVADGSERISADDLRSILVQQLRFNPYLDDADYMLLDRRRVKDFLRCDGTDHYVYGKQGRDCDNFARVLDGRVQELAFLSDSKYGPAFGTIGGKIWKGGDEPTWHKMNVVVTTDGDVWLIEPQNDGWFRPDERDTYNFCCM